MSNNVVSIVRYREPYQSVKEAVEACNGLDHMPSNARVFIKPNIVFWTKATRFPKWGVITTSRVIEDMVVLLKEYGIEDIIIGEGIVGDSKDTETPAHAFETLGYAELNRRYGAKPVNLMESSFEEVDVGDGITLKFSEEIMKSDFVVNLPVMKSHNQTVISLGIKNLKGTIDTNSRKKCHSADPEKDLHFFVSRLADKMPPMFTLVDGIYTLERGPSFDGKMNRKDVLVASPDVLSADMVGAKVLGHEPTEVKHLVQAAETRGRPSDLSDVSVVGEKIEDVASYHQHTVKYISDEEKELPEPLARQGMTGLFYRKFDSTMCTYCSALNGLILTAIRNAWNGEPFDNVEVLNGKAMKPTPGMNTTVLLGQCMYRLNKDDPSINNKVSIKGCPPEADKIPEAFKEAGIQVDENLFAQRAKLPGYFMARYQDKPEYDESFFQVE